MNRNSINKLKFMLMGLESRIKENMDLMESMEVVFHSGLKKYKANGIFKEDGIEFNYKGVTSVKSASSIFSLILEEASSYDSLIISLKERGTLVEVTANDKDIKVRNKEIEVKKDEHSEDTSTLLNRKYLINHIKARNLLRELGILTKDGKVKNDMIRKYNQIDRYVEILEKDLSSFKDKKIHIVDCGCGKSYLSFVLNYYLTEVKKMKCYFTGIDISEKVIEASRKMAENLGYKNMEFIKGDIKNLKLSKTPDVVMSLHACDTATDLALSFGVKNDAKMIVAVPCCHAEMNRKYEFNDLKGIMKQGILKRRLADVLTDGLRCLFLESRGYNVTIEEYISPLETPKNLLIRALYTGRINSESENEVTRLMVKLNYAPALYRYLNDLEDEE